MTAIALDPSVLLPGCLSAEIQMILDALRAAGHQINHHGQVMCFSMEEAEDLAIRIKSRWGHARSFREASRSWFPSRTSAVCHRVSRTMISILRGDLEGDQSQIMTWVRRRCANEKAGIYPFLKEFLCRRELLSSQVPDDVERRAVSIRENIAKSKWPNLSEQDQNDMRAFLQYVCARSSEGTARVYKSGVSHLVRLMSANQHLSLSAIRPEHISTIVAAMNRTGLSRNYQNLVLAALRHFFQWQREDNGGTCPVFRHHYPKRSAGGTMPLTPQEVLRIRTSLDASYQGSIARALFYLIYLTGLRPTEALSVRAADITRERMDLFVARGKGRKSCAMPIATYVCDRIDEWLATSPLPNGCEHVFHRKGLQISLESANRLREDIARASGIPFTWRQLRTTFATRMAEYGVSPFIIRGLLRHTKLNSIMTYIKLSDPAVREGYARFADEVSARPAESGPKHLGTAAALIRSGS